MRVPKLAGGPDRGNQSTGSGGAPKFQKNWLPFACSPYDPDHISGPPGSDSALRGTPLIGFACLATLLNAWEQLYFFKETTKEQKKQIIAQSYNKIKKKIREKFLYIMRVPKLAGGPDRGNQSTGSGGAPKFQKNWLPFACSPYDPDHISGPPGSDSALRGTPLIGFACLATLLNAWEQLYFLTN